MKRKVSEAPTSLTLRRRSPAAEDAGNNDRLTVILRQAYRSVLSEPVPARLLQFMKQVERRGEDP